MGAWPLDGPRLDLPGGRQALAGRENIFALRESKEKGSVAGQANFCQS